MPARSHEETKKSDTVPSIFKINNQMNVVLTV